MADNASYFHDMLEPFLLADQTAITGTTEALLWPARFSRTNQDYWHTGKKWWIVAYGKITTAASSQGNITLQLRFGQTTAGTALGVSAATALVASATNQPWRFEAFISCSADGSSGTIRSQGKFETVSGVVASPSTVFIPPTSTTVDTTASTTGIVLGVTLGSASDSMTCQELIVTSMS